MRNFSDSGWRDEPKFKSQNLRRSCTLTRASRFERRARHALGSPPFTTHSSVEVLLVVLFQIMSPKDVEDDDNVILEEEAMPRRKKKKVEPRLFADSDLTDAQRREIRQSQRTLQQTLRDGELASMEELEEARNVNNEIFATSVKYTREGTAYTGVLFHLLFAVLKIIQHGKKEKQNTYCAM